MNSGNNYKKILLGIGILAVALLASYYLVYSDIKSKNENISALEDELSSQTEKETLNQSMISSLKKDELSIDLVNRSFVGKDEDVSFIEDLESLARDNNLKMTIDSLVFQDTPNLSTSTAVFFVIKAKTSGQWSGTYTFLSELESLPVKVKISRFSFSNADDLVGGEGKKNGTTGNAWDTAFEVRVLKSK